MNKYADWLTRLTEPSPTVVGEMARVQARLMASLMLVGMPVVASVALIARLAGDYSIATSIWFSVGILVTAGLMIAYLMSKRGFYQQANLLVIILATASVFIPASLVGGRLSYNSLFYLVVVTLFSGLYQSIKVATWILLVHLIGILVVGSIMSDGSVQDVVIGPFIFNLFASGSILLFIYYQRLITHQQQIALSTSEARYRMISEVISDYAFHYRVEPDGKIVLDWVTDSFERLTGYSAAELSFRNFEDIVLPEDRARLQTDRLKVINGDDNIGEYRITTKGGELRWLRIHRRPVWNADHTRVIGGYGAVQDITARKQAEVALTVSEERYRVISEMISDYAYYYRIEPDGTRVREWITQSLFRERNSGTSEDIAESSIISRVHPDDVRLLDIHRDAAMRGEPAEGEYRIVTHEGLRWVQVRRQPVWDENHSRVTGFYGVVTDVTERKLTEAQKIRLALEEERLNTVSQFVQALSHDFRTLLATIETSRYLIERLLSDQERHKIQSKLKTIQNSVLHLAEQIENLHMVAAIDSLYRTSVDLNWLVETLIVTLQAPAHEKGITLDFKPATPVQRIEVDQSKIERAIRHLLTNAVAHTESGGFVTVRTWRQDQEVLIEVQDSGSGIEPEILAQIFEPFYRADAARSVGQGGIGLGLTIVKMTIEAHQGHIHVESRIGEGSRFTITLPLAAEVTDLEAQPV